ncbi:hypothetical protein Acr_06g0006250 [Actinidia rufa]|uniref:Uncharacterized protein n=1 Tax=Actinidia rufa TaxID=165716 RepID=A0A7J0EQB6_9ERIC|nr:hypothetical protein Acr_06g0006250 [Actinidia rufa]
MDVLRRQASKLREQVAKQQQTQIDVSPVRFLWSLLVSEVVTCVQCRIQS